MFGGLTLTKILNSQYNSVMEMAFMTLGETPHGLRRSIPRQDDSCRHQFSFQVDQSLPNDSSTSTKVIELSRTLFSQFSIPEVLDTDNGLCFVSEEFKTFLSKNGIKHITSVLFHLATNGLAKHAVQILKKGLKKEKGGTMASRIAKVLMAYRIAPQSTTGLSPSELLQGR